MKKIKLLTFFLIIFLFGVTCVSAQENGVVLAINPNQAICHEVAVLRAIRIIAIVIMVIKIMVPVLLIVMGIKDLAKAVIQGDDGDIKNFFPLFMARLCTGVFVFFIPACVHAIMSVAHGYDNTKSKFTDCGKCLTSVKNCDSLIKTYTK